MINTTHLLSCLTGLCMNTKAVSSASGEGGEFSVVIGQLLKSVMTAFNLN